MSEAQKATFYITTTNGMRGWFAVMVRVDPDGFEERQMTSPRSHINQEQAEGEAAEWAKEEDLEFIQ